MLDAWSSQSSVAPPSPVDLQAIADVRVVPPDLHDLAARARPSCRLRTPPRTSGERAPDLPTPYAASNHPEHAPLHDRTPPRRPKSQGYARLENSCHRRTCFHIAAWIVEPKTAERSGSTPSGGTTMRTIRRPFTALVSCTLLAAGGRCRGRADRRHRQRRHRRHRQRPGRPRSRRVGHRRDRRLSTRASRRSSSPTITAATSSPICRPRTIRSGCAATGSSIRRRSRAAPGKRWISSRTRRRRRPPPPSCIRPRTGTR